MDKRFKNINVLIWDVDHTLARSDDLWPAIKRGQRVVIAKHRKISLKKAQILWDKHRSQFASTTKLTAFLIDKDPVETGKQIDKLARKHTVLSRDPELVGMFRRLTMFDHYICGNGTVQSICDELKAVGLAQNIFKKIVGIDIAGKPKPSQAGFVKIIELTQQAPKKHLMIGDRDETDLVPAKRLGMMTCMVYGDSKIADVSLPTIYELPDLLGV